MESSGCQILDIILHHENLLHIFNTSSAHHFIHLEYQSVIFIQEKTTKICIKTISLPYFLVQNPSKTISFPYVLICCRWSSHFHSFPIHRHRLDLRPPWSPAPWDRSCRSLRAAPAAGRRRCGLHPTPMPTGDLSKGPKGTWQRGTKGEPKKTKWNS